MDGVMYFWEDGKLIISEHPDWPAKNACFCVDGRYPTSEPEERYGRVKQELGKVHYSWVHLPLEQFPKEFRTHLLLLGVS
jgi:hypothetical protein